MTTLNREYLENLYGKEYLSKRDSIDLKEKNLIKIDPKTFKDLSGLISLDLSQNNFKTIKSGTFKNLSKLRLLKLNDNQVENIKQDLFKDLSNLKELALHNNSLKQIDSNAFKGLDNLQELELYNNKLENISANSFENLVNLKLLKLNKNQLKELDRKCFEPLKSIEIILLYDNQFSYESYILPTTQYEKWNYNFDKLKENGFRKNWNKFLKQFTNPRLETDETDKKNIENNKDEDAKNQETLGKIKQDEKTIENNNVEDENNNKLLRLIQEKEKLEKRNKQLEEELRMREEKEKMEAEKIAKQRNLEEEIEGLLESIKIRDVKSSTISSAWITHNKNKDDLKGQVIDGRYKIDTFKGKGGFGKVYTIFDQKDQKEQNKIKIIKFMVKTETDWKKEATLLSRLNHKNIVKYEDTFRLLSKESLYYPCILTEYCENGDLASKIEEMKKKQTRFEDKTILNWIYEAADGVRYLHSLNVVHRDIKPQNILLTIDNVLKLADLGSAKVLKDSLRSGKPIGSINYMSPELLNSEKYSLPTDIWSLGCVLYELVFLQSAKKNIGKEHPFRSLLFSSSIKNMLVEDPNGRIDAQKLFEDLLKIKQLLTI